ncbi:hypothetical protein P692DRAFT_20197153 [Suillus brevipes Sb2]|nr:hypothetical protein P692DRAFT_20197153 [Suillus brevipes Sb2]
MIQFLFFKSVENRTAPTIPMLLNGPATSLPMSKFHIHAAKSFAPLAGSVLSTETSAQSILRFQHPTIDIPTSSDDLLTPLLPMHLPRKHSALRWCPTSLFNFLPLHAAGEYRANGDHDRSPSVPFAAIGQNLPAGASFTLDCVEPELELVRSLLPLPPTVSFTKITSVDATKSRALRALRDNTWLHFSCHGTQKSDDPFKSAFLMRDQPLTLLDITQMDLSLHEFAFLSACDTAVGVPTTPDEVIHLAAGLQFAGVKSVVGTLWKVTDATVQRLVEEFYKNFCKDGTMNSKRAARALHQAVHSLVRDRDMPLDQRIVFMHIGA